MRHLAETETGIGSFTGTSQIGGGVPVNFIGVTRSWDRSTKKKLARKLKPLIGSKRTRKLESLLGLNDEP